MTGGTVAHAAIQPDLIGLPYNRMRGHRCQVYGSKLKIQAGQSIRYLDAFVVCSTTPPGTLVVTEPMIVFEILRPSTATIDHIDKNPKIRNTGTRRRSNVM
jgi:hypothetical protein